MSKKLAAIILTVSMLISLLPIAANAAGEIPNLLQAAKILMEEAGAAGIYDIPYFYQTDQAAKTNWVQGIARAQIPNGNRSPNVAASNVPAVFIPDIIISATVAPTSDPGLYEVELSAGGNTLPVFTIPVTEQPAPGANPVIAFDPSLITSAMNQATGAFTRRSGTTGGFYVNGSIAGAPRYAIMEWSDTAGQNAGIAFRYLASINAVAPGYTVGASTKTVETRVLEHIRYIIDGNREWGASGNGLSGRGYYNWVLGLAIVKIQSPATFAKLSPAEQAKVDLLMEATLIGGHYASADANYETEGGGLGPAVVPWFTQEFDTSTGIDQTGNYRRDWNVNHRLGILTAVMAYYYFGGSDGGSDYCNGVLADFDYAIFMDRLLKAGFSNTYSVFTNAGADALAGSAATGNELQARTRSSANSDAGEFMYYGEPMSNIGYWLMSFIEISVAGGPVRPYGGDTQRPNLTPLVQLVTPSTNSINRPFGYPGFIDDLGDALLNFPNLGAPGMQMEFDTNDAGYDANVNDYGLDSAALTSRSAVSYVEDGLPYMQGAFFMLQAFDEPSADGSAIAGIPVERYADVLIQTMTGIADYNYKGTVGYYAFHKGKYRGRQVKSNNVSFRYQDDIWLNVTDNSNTRIAAVNAADTVAGLRELVEDPLFGLVLFQFNGLSSAGQENAIAALLAGTGSFLTKTQIQDALGAAVAVEAVREFNEMLANPGTSAQDVLDALHVDLRRAGLPDDYADDDDTINEKVYYTSLDEYENYNSLGIFVYGFTDFYAYRTPAGQATRLDASKYVLDNAPAGGYADRRAIRDAIVAGLAAAPKYYNVGFRAFDGKNSICYTQAVKEGDTINWNDVAKQYQLYDGHIWLDIESWINDSTGVPIVDLDMPINGNLTLAPQFYPAGTALVLVTGPDRVATGAGALATYTITARNMPPVSAIELEFEVDGRYLSSKDFSGLSGFSIFGNGNYGTRVYWKNDGDKWIGKVTLLDLSAAGVVDAADVFNMEFYVKEGVLGEAAVKINYVLMSYGNGVPVQVEIVKDTASTIFEQWYSPFDLNKDGTIDINDLTFALQYLTITNQDAEWDEAQVCDFVQDGTIDILDLIQILANYTIPYYS